MKWLVAHIIGFLLLAGCAHRNHGVIASLDPKYTTVDASKIDKIRVSWGAHGGVWITTVTLVRPTDWVVKESIRTIKTNDSITVCYSKTPRPGKVSAGRAEPVHLTIIADGVRWHDKRQILLSDRCGRRL
jgi:hypothetical protein